MATTLSRLTNGASPRRQVVGQLVDLGVGEPPAGQIAGGGDLDGGLAGQPADGVLEDLVQEARRQGLAGRAELGFEGAGPLGFGDHKGLTSIVRDAIVSVIYKSDTTA